MGSYQLFRFISVFILPSYFIPNIYQHIIQCNIFSRYPIRINIKLNVAIQNNSYLRATLDTRRRLVVRFNSISTSHITSASIHRLRTRRGRATGRRSHNFNLARQHLIVARTWPSEHLTFRWVCGTLATFNQVRHFLFESECSRPDAHTTQRSDKLGLVGSFAYRIAEGYPST